MEKIVRNGEEGYFLTEKDYQSMMESYNRLETLLTRMGRVIE